MKLLVVAVLLASAIARAEEPAADRLRQAQDFFQQGEYGKAAGLAGQVARDPSLPQLERGEGYRIYGLSLFLVGLEAEAEAALLEYLRREPDAHLDPALVPPAAVVFFDDVRARHAAEILRYKPRPQRKLYWWWNLVPSGGQFQNGARGKAWTVLAAEVLLLAANVTTYFMLASMCEEADGTCEDEDTAKTLQTTNLITGSLFIAVWAYSAVDGFLGYRERLAKPERGVAVFPVDGGVMVGWGGRF